MPGYSGGQVENPTYEEVSSGTSGHAETVQIEFNPGGISYDDLLYVFWKTHDPTQLNRQGPDIGSQYRSAIFYHSPIQKEKAEKSLGEAQALYDKKIVTEIVPFKNFYPAEEYHREFYFKNRKSPYCRLVIDPKIQKLRKELGKFLK